MTNIAVVILNYNGRDLLRTFLPSIIQHSHGAEIILVDNGSTDDSVAVAAKDFPAVRLIRISSNLGFCGGYNHALKQIQADYFVLINTDVEVTPGWLGPLSRLLDTDPSIAAVQPKILSYNNRKYFEYAGAGGGQLDALGYPFCRGRLFYLLEEDQGQYNDTLPIFWASGACMMVRARLFEELNGFDEDYFAHMEEIDLSWRLQRAGYKIYYTGESTVYHAGGSTLSAANPRKTYLNFKNGLSLIYKNLPVAELAYKFPIRIVLDWVACIKFSVSGSWPHGQAVFQAHRDFFRNYGKERVRRKLTESFGYRKLANQYSGSVVWDVFVAGKKKYADLGH